MGHDLAGGDLDRVPRRLVAEPQYAEQVPAGGDAADGVLPVLAGGFDPVRSRQDHARILQWLAGRCIAHLSGYGALLCVEAEADAGREEHRAASAHVCPYE